MVQVHCALALTTACIYCMYTLSTPDDAIQAVSAVATNEPVSTAQLAATLSQLRATGSFAKKAKGGSSSAAAAAANSSAALDEQEQPALPPWGANFGRRGVTAALPDGTSLDAAAAAAAVQKMWMATALEGRDLGLHTSAVAASRAVDTDTLRELGTQASPELLNHPAADYTLSGTVWVLQPAKYLDDEHRVREWGPDDERKPASVTLPGFEALSKRGAGRSTGKAGSSSSSSGSSKAAEEEAEEEPEVRAARLEQEALTAEAAAEQARVEAEAAELEKVAYHERTQQQQYCDQRQQESRTSMQEWLTRSMNKYFPMVATSVFKRSADAAPAPVAAAAAVAVAPPVDSSEDEADEEDDSNSFSDEEADSNDLYSSSSREHVDKRARTAW
jgi:hypothetical protein